MSLEDVTAYLPTPTARDWKGHNQRADGRCLPGVLLPTPRASDGYKGSPNQRGSGGDLMLPTVIHTLSTGDATATPSADGNES